MRYASCASWYVSMSDTGPGTVEDVFCQTFVVEVPAYGATCTIPLKPGGEDVVVTEDNRQEFVDLYVKFWLHTSIENQFEVRQVKPVGISHAAHGRMPHAYHNRHSAGAL